MSTSLAAQLKRLATPQGNLLLQDKKRASILFDPRDAAGKDRETFYEIGLSGLEELKKLNRKFQIFEATLFNVASKDFERSVEVKETNEKLDKNIRQFLLLLSPYFLIPAAHKCLEWLINRFHIQLFNKKDILMLILPYHETKIFARCVQLLDVSSASDEWHWLETAQKAGVPLSKTAVLNRCANDISFLKFICKLTTATIKENENKANNLTTLFSFYMTSLVGSLEHAKTITEPHVSTILPSVIKSLSSDVLDYTSAGYMILGQLVIKAKLSENALHQLITKISFSPHAVLRSEAVLLILLIYQSQNELLKTVPQEALYFICKTRWFTVALAQLATTGAPVIELVIPLLSGILQTIQTDPEDSTVLKTFADSLVAELTFNDADAGKVIRCVLENYQSEEFDENEDDNISMDIDKPNLKEIQTWFSLFLKNLEISYSDIFDKVIKNTLQGKGSRISKRSLKSILSFLPYVSHEVGNTSVFENLYHYNSDCRILAIEYLQDKIRSLNFNDDLLRNGITERLNDDDPLVVKAVLKFDPAIIVKLINSDQLAKSLFSIFSKSLSNDKWADLAPDVLKLLCSENIEVDESNILIAILPFILSKGNNLLEKTVIKESYFGSNNILIKNAIEGGKFSIREPISATAVFKLLQQTKNVPNLNSLLNVKNIENFNSVDKVMYLMLLNAALPEKANSELSRKVLDATIDLVADANVVLVKGGVDFNFKVVTNSILNASLNEFPLQLLLHCIKKIILSSDISNIKGWLNIYEQTPETSFVLELFQLLLTACNFSEKEVSQSYTVALKTFFDKYLPNFNEKIEFLSNLFLGHCIQKQATSYFVEITPEFELRTLNLVLYLLRKGDDPLEWILNSDIVVPSLLIALTCPIKHIRTVAFKILKLISAIPAQSENKYYNLVQMLIVRQSELLLDHEQLPLILYTLLSPDESVQKTLKKDKYKSIESLKVLIELVKKPHPNYVTSSLLSVLKYVNSGDILNQVTTQALIILKKIESNAVLDIYDGEIIQNIISRIDKDTIHVVDENIASWNLICKCLKQYNMKVVQNGTKTTTPAVLLMNQINNELFINLPEKYHKELLGMVIDCATDSDNAVIVSVAHKVLKRIELSANLISEELKLMRDAKTVEIETTNRRRINRRVSNLPSPDLLLTRAWKRGITLLEFIQNKKKISDIEVMLPVIFDILKRCLEFEEQSPVEYTKQLLLSFILHSCQKLSPSGTLVQHLPSNIFNIELVVQCIRATQNPQTHHHAVLVLSHTAGMLPDQVLHNIMSIFTFMGSSILRHDDAYSFQIISKLIETVIPILIKSELSDELNDQQVEKLNKSVIPVLRVFVDVLLDIPEHRRLPLFKKLLETLKPKYFLWVFLGLVFESHAIHAHQDKTDKGELPRRLEIAGSITREFEPDVIIETCNKLLLYLKSLPVEKEENSITGQKDQTIIFDVNKHLSKQFRHFKYTLITFLSGLITYPGFVTTLAALSDDQIAEMEPLYKSMIINTLTYIHSVSKTADANNGKPQAKYWKVMLHYSYEVLDNVNSLLSADMFILVIRGLMSHNLSTVRRKAMELLISRLQHQITFFDSCDKESLNGFLPPLTAIIQTIDADCEMDGTSELELEILQQTALLAVKLLVKYLAPENPSLFVDMLKLLTDLVRSKKIDGNVLASVVLCLAEICSNLRAHSITQLAKFMPALLKVLAKQTEAENPDIVLLSTITALQKIIETLPLFLSPYLETILLELSLLSIKFNSNDPKAAPLILKLKSISSKISTTITSRVLIPAVCNCYNTLLENEQYHAVGSVVGVLAESFSNITSAEFNSLQSDLTAFFLHALNFRCDVTTVSKSDIGIVEGHVLDAIVTLVLKLSETSFKPLYYKIFDWASRSSTNNKRIITFYRLSNKFAECLKSLFVVFAGHFVKNAADLLDKSNTLKDKELYFNDEDNNIILIEEILKTLTAVFTYDTQNFVNKDRFEILLKPIVDQLENELGGSEKAINRANTLVVQCIAQFAVATADDSLWKQLNYQVLLKTRCNSVHLRLCGLHAMHEMAKRLGEDFLPLLPETIPFLAELLEDEDETVLVACQKVISDLEAILGEPLQKYF